MHSFRSEANSSASNKATADNPQSFPLGSSMVGSILAGCLVLASFAAATEYVAPKVTVNNEDHRSIREYRLDVKAFMKLSKNDDEQTQRNAIFNLCELHRELVADSRFESSTQIQSFRRVVANRLENYSKDVKKRLAIEERKQKKSKNSSANKLASTSYADDKDTNSDSNEPTSSSGEKDPSETSDSEEYDAMYQAASDSYNSMTKLSGGPNNLFNYAGGRFAPPWDHGPELVALITNTIDPSFWRQNGGNGSIHYFQPLRVLVIGATTRVHQDTHELLWKIREAGR